MKAIEHDPEANLDYAWDWSGWLDDGEVISTASVSVEFPDPDVAVGVVTYTDDRVVAWASGGQHGRNYPLVCHIVTNSGREDDRKSYC